MAAEMTVRRVDSASIADFWGVHRDDEGCGWCYCVAWWVPTFEGFSERKADENRALRESVFARGERDGYVAYVGGEPAGWLQSGPRDGFPQLRTRFDLAPDPRTHALTCFTLRPRFRKRGLAHAMLAGALDDLRTRGVARVEGYPHPGRHEGDSELWAGPEPVFVRAGFALVKETPKGRVYARTL